MNIIAKILKGYKNINSFYLIDCEVNEHIMLTLGNVQQVTALMFGGCGITKPIADLLSELVYVNLIHLNINTDTTGNRGIKKLIKTNMPHLISLQLSNTNITAEYIKVYKKKQFYMPLPQVKLWYSGYLKLAVKKQRLFRYDQWLK